MGPLWGQWLLQDLVKVLSHGKTLHYSELDPTADQYKLQMHQELKNRTKESFTLNVKKQK